MSTMWRVWTLAMVVALSACASGVRGGDDERDPATGPWWERSTGSDYAFRGIGQEPGWTVEVAPGATIRAVLDYGDSEVVWPAPPPRRDGGRLVYESRTDAHALRLVIEETECSDAMSGEPFSHTVLMVVDGRELRGCGSPLFGPGAGLDGSWTLVELGGAPALGGMGGERPHLRIDGGRVGGDTGCNSFGGSFTREGDRIAFGGIAMTRRACVEQALNDQERRLSEALAAADRATVAADTLDLFRGDARLARFVRRAPG
jgi:heat shock protein HslJ